MDFLSLFSDPHAWVSLLTLTILEIILGVDNLIVIAILCDKLPKARQALARRLGLIVALVTRIAFLSLAFFIAHMEKNLFTILGNDISIRDVLLIGGGLFLLGKASTEIYERIEEGEEVDHAPANVKVVTLQAILVQVAFMDIVFSFDSVMTAIGLANHLPVMVLAVILSILVMIWAIEPINRLLTAHPSLKILALSFLLLIGMTLIGEGFDAHISKGYLYFAMAFSIGVEVVNILIRRKNRKVLK